MTAMLIRMVVCVICVAYEPTLIQLTQMMCVCFLNARTVQLLNDKSCPLVAWTKSPQTMNNEKFHILSKLE